MPSMHPLSHYTDFNLDPTHESTVINTAPPPLADIPGAFDRIAPQGEVLAAWDSGVFRTGREYRYTGQNLQGVDAGINHFQGVARLGRGGQAFLVLSAGDSTELVSQLFVIRMGSKPVHGPWGSNLRVRGTPPDEDGLVRVIALDRNCWHAGGLGLLGDVLAVPLEGRGRSAVRFLHVADPLNPTQLPITIERPDLANAGAATLGVLPDGHFLCLVWREEGTTKPVGRLDCYVSVSTRLLDGFGPRVSAEFTPARELKRDPMYQTILLLKPDNQHSGPELFYLLGAENAAKGSPTENGANVVDLYRVLPRSSGPATAAGACPIGAIEYVRSHTYHAPRTFCNFDAAVGGFLDVSASGTNLHLYGAFHWRLNQTIQFAEFSSRPAAEVELTDIADARIELYEHDTFRGRTLTVVGLQGSSIANYAGIYVQDGDFDERVSSVRWHMPVGWTYRLFREPGFSGAMLELRGTGRREEIADLSRRKFGDVVSSSRYASRPESSGSPDQ
jgi:hypothetical protein